MTSRGIEYAGKNDNRLLSPALWGKFPIEAIQAGRIDGIFLFDDFCAAPVFANTAGLQNGYFVFNDVGVTLQAIPTTTGGVLQIAGADADNDEGYLTDAGNVGAYCKIAKSGGKKLIFEARFSVDSIVDRGLFIGLSEEGLAAAGTLADNTAALASKDFIGFHVAAATPSVLNFVYRKAGQAMVTVAAAQTLVAGTYYKGGFIFDPKEPDTDKKIRFYVNGTENATGVSQANLEAATFPDGEELCRLFGIKAGEAVEKKANLDWWAVGQLG